MYLGKTLTNLYHLLTEISTPQPLQAGRGKKGQPGHGGGHNWKTPSYQSAIIHPYLPVCPDVAVKELGPPGAETAVTQRVCSQREGRMEVLGRARPDLAQTQSEITPCSRPPTLSARRFGDCAQSHPATPASSPAPTRSLLALAGFSGRVLEAAPCLFSARRVVSTGYSPSPASDARGRAGCPLPAEDAAETAGGRWTRARQLTEHLSASASGRQLIRPKSAGAGPLLLKRMLIG